MPKKGKGKGWTPFDEWWVGPPPEEVAQSARVPSPKPPPKPPPKPLTIRERARELMTNNESLKDLVKEVVKDPLGGYFVNLYEAHEHLFENPDSLEVYVEGRYNSLCEETVVLVVSKGHTPKELQEKMADVVRPIIGDNDTLVGKVLGVPPEVLRGRIDAFRVLVTKNAKRRKPLTMSCSVIAPPCVLEKIKGALIAYNQSVCPIPGGKFLTVDNRLVRLGTVGAEFLRMKEEYGSYYTGPDRCNQFEMEEESKSVSPDGKTPIRVIPVLDTTSADVSMIFTTSTKLTKPQFEFLLAYIENTKKDFDYKHRFGYDDF